MEKNRKKFSRYYFLTSFTIIFIFTIGMGTYFVLSKYAEFKEYVYNDKVADIENKKMLMKDMVDSYISQAEQVIKSSEDTLDRIIYNRVNTAYNISLGVYKHNTDNPNVSRAVKAALASMVYGNEYIFVFDMNGNIISSPLLSKIEGKSMLNKQDAEGNYTLRDSIKIIRERGEGFLDTYWQNPADPNAGLRRKRVYIKYFEPLNWVIGYGIYIDDHEDNIKNEVLRNFESVTYSNGGYIFATTYDGVSLTKPAKGKNMYNVQDTNGKYIVRDLIALSKQGGGYYEYVMPPFKGARPERKLSYVAPMPRWGWYVGTGMYVTDIEELYNTRIDSLFNSEKKEITIVVLGLFALLIVGTAAVYIFSGRLQALVDRYSSELSRKNSELEELNQSLEEHVDEKTAELNELNRSLEVRVREEVDKNRDKDRIMFQQGRLAAMGEMIGNIAHQWRQPLSSISLLVQDIQEAHSCGELNEDYINDSVAKCNVTIKHMSDTIDNFRFFFNPQKDNKSFSVNDEITRSISILDAALENNNIKVIQDLRSKREVYGVAGEYSQVLVNIVSNAKDILLLRGVETPMITVNSYDLEDNVVVEIFDNGGGITEKNFDKIFEPYFTTKTKSQGTGIGLYFSKMIIEGNMNGSLQAENTKLGACFRIIVPAV